MMVINGAQWMWRAAALLVASQALMLSIPADAKGKEWDHIANIKSSATQLAQLQIAKGAQGTYEFIAACYKTHSLNSEFGAALEGCLVLDYIHSNVTAAVYAKVDPQERGRMGMPEPRELVGTMLKRVGDAMANYKITEAEARKFIADVDKYGTPVFTKARFPKAPE